jgi:drug/metabolite transporter (DMT)-like permease
MAWQASQWAPLSFFLLVLGNISWALGTIYSKRIQSSASVFMRVSIQMISGGLCFLMAGVFSGEWTSFFTAPIELQSILALVYLIAFPSLIAYLAYTWLLTVRPAAQVGTFAYVNPVVAVFLGYAFNGEQLSPVIIGALISILLGVVLVSISFRRPYFFARIKAQCFHSINEYP